MFSVVTHSRLTLWIDAALVSVLVPCAWLFIGALEVRRLRLLLRPSMYLLWTGKCACHWHGVKFHFHVAFTWFLDVVILLKIHFKGVRRRKQLQFLVFLPTHAWFCCAFSTLVNSRPLKIKTDIAKYHVITKLENGIKDFWFSVSFTSRCCLQRSRELLNRSSIFTKVIYLHQV